MAQPADIYSLGVLLHELYVGPPPWRRGRPSSISGGGVGASSASAATGAGARGADMVGGRLPEAGRAAAAAAGGGGEDCTSDSSDQPGSGGGHAPHPGGGGHGGGGGGVGGLAKASSFRVAPRSGFVPSLPQHCPVSLRDLILSCTCSEPKVRKAGANQHSKYVDKGDGDGDLQGGEGPLY